MSEKEEIDLNDIEGKNINKILKNISIVLILYAILFLILYPPLSEFYSDLGYIESVILWTMFMLPWSMSLLSTIFMVVYTNKVDKAAFYLEKIYNLLNTAHNKKIEDETNRNDMDKKNQGKLNIIK